MLANNSFSSTSYWPMTSVLYCFQKCENLLKSKYLAPSRGGHWGVPNTAIPKEKLWNTEIPCPKSTKYRYRIYDRSRFTSIYSHLACLPPIACMHQKSTSDIVRKYEKTLNWSLQGLKSSVIPFTSKFLTFINLFSLLWFLLGIVLTYRNTVRDLLLPNTVNQKGENRITRI